MTVVLPDARFGMTQVDYNLDSLPKDIPEYECLAAANKFNEHRYKQLTHKQRVFVSAYLEHRFDYVRAAIEAGYEEHEAKRVGKKMLDKPVIKSAIHYALNYFSEKSKLRFQDVIDELRCIGFSSITDLVNPLDGKPRELDPDDPKWRAVKTIRVRDTKYGKLIEYTMHDKLGALDKLGRIIDPSKMPPDPSAPGNNTTVNIQNVNIVPVPQGQFLPAPQLTYDETEVLDVEFDPVAHQAAP